MQHLLFDTNQVQKASVQHIISLSLIPSTAFQPIPDLGLVLIWPQPLSLVYFQKTCSAMIRRHARAVLPHGVDQLQGVKVTFTFYQPTSCRTTASTQTTKILPESSVLDLQYLLVLNSSASPSCWYSDYGLHSRNLRWSLSRG